MSGAVGLDWRANCPKHGKDTEYYKLVLLPKYEEQDRKLLELQRLRREKYDSSKSN